MIWTGTFSLQDVAPGSYTLVAIENGWDLDWSQPGVIAVLRQARTHNPDHGYAGEAFAGRRACRRRLEISADQEGTRGSQREGIMSSKL